MDTYCHHKIDSDGSHLAGNPPNKINQKNFYVIFGKVASGKTLTGMKLHKAIQNSILFDIDYVIGNMFKDIESDTGNGNDTYQKRFNLFMDLIEKNILETNVNNIIIVAAYSYKDNRIKQLAQKYNYDIIYMNLDENVSDKMRLDIMKLRKYSDDKVVKLKSKNFYA